MQFTNRHTVSLIALVATGLSIGCSSDNTKSPTADAGSGGTSGAGGTSGSGGGGVVDSGKCDVTVSPSANDLQTVQGALDTQVKSGNTLCFSPGTYKFKNNIALASAKNVTFRGTGATRDDVLLDFTGQTQGKQGVLVQTDDFTVMNLSIKNTANNGIAVEANNSTFRNIHVYWDNLTVGTPGTDGGTNSGAYGIYPTSANKTLIEDSEVSGAADAGVYAGQCTHVIVQNNKVHDNVLGIEVENATGADVHDNEVYNNSTGFLLDLLPGLAKHDATDYRVYKNNVYDNNHPNFGQAGTDASSAPQGTGFLVLASSNIEITANTITGNDFVAVAIISYDTFDLIGGSHSAPDPKTNRYPDHIYVHDNTFANNGSNPPGIYQLFGVADAGKTTIPYDVLWDGILDPKGYNDAGTSSVEAAKICLGKTEQATFVNFQGTKLFAAPPVRDFITDPADHQCTLNIPSIL